MFSFIKLSKLGKHVLASGEDNNLSLPSGRTSRLKPEICISPEPGMNKFQQWRQVGWMLAHHMDGISSSRFFTWPSIAQSFLSRHGGSNPRFTRVRQFVSFRFDITSLCRSINSKTTHMYIARARGEPIAAMVSRGLHACSSWGQAIEFQVLFLILLSI